VKRKHFRCDRCGKRVMAPLAFERGVDAERCDECFFTPDGMREVRAIRTRHAKAPEVT
jgi:hypothetical protein